MQKRAFKFMAGVVAIGAMALGGTAVASASQKAPAVPPSAAVHAQEQPGVQTQEQPGVDNDSIQDENGADDVTELGGAEEPESSEAESAAEQPGDDGPGGHADEPGNPDADHQFEGQE